MYSDKKNLKNAIFWDVALCRSYVNRCFGHGYSHLLILVPRLRIFLPEDGLKHQFTQYLHTATSQKTAFFIVTAVKTSNLKKKKLCKGTAHTSSHPSLDCYRTYCYFPEDKNYGVLFSKMISISY
jgi:hypothetical protein